MTQVCVTITASLLMISLGIKFVMMPSFTFNDVAMMNVSIAAWMAVLKMWRGTI